MVLLTAVLGLRVAAVLAARAGTAPAALPSLFQFLLMGLNGAFLTGDLFNLFVFFEVLLAASYGLALHGSGAARVQAGLHYIVVNLAASLLFLIGVSLIYGVTGTLNMADLARGSRRAPRTTARCSKPARRSSASPSWSRPACGRCASGCRAAMRRRRARRRAVRDPEQGRRSTPCCGSGCCSSARTRGDSPASGGTWLVVGGLVHDRLRRDRRARVAGTVAARGLQSSSSRPARCSRRSGAGHVAVSGAALFYLVVSTLGVVALLPADRTGRTRPRARGRTCWR